MKALTMHTKHTDKLEFPVAAWAHSYLRVGGVTASIMGASVAPLRVSSVLGGLRQGGEGPPVIALQLPDLHAYIISTLSTWHIVTVMSPW